MNSHCPGHVWSALAHAVLVLTATAICISCSGDETSVDEPYGIAELDLKGESRFLKKIGEERYEETEPPQEAPVFRWDFGRKRVHTYAYEQEMRSRIDMGIPSGRSSADMGQKVSAKGTLLIKSQGNGTADLVLRDMKMRMEMSAGKHGEPSTMEQEAPPVVVQALREDGSGSFGDSSQDMLLRALFPLPSKPLAVGESVDVPSQMPFNAMGSVLQVTGRSRITLTRYVRIGTRTCACLDVDTDISELEVPAELKGDYKCAAKGTSVFYFDVADRSFVSGAIALLMQFAIDAPAPKVTFPGSAAPDILGRSKMSMSMDTLIRVRLKE